jgi:hypothetical protein
MKGLFPMLRPAAVLSALVALAAPACAVELPPHKPGLWQMTVLLGAKDAPAVTVKRCTDAETDTLLAGLARGWAHDACARQDVKRDGDRLVIDSTCTVGPATTTTHAEITGSFDDAYTLKVATRRESRQGAAGRSAERTITMDAKWLGPCEAGQKPGDIVLPGGVTMNVRNFGAVLGLSPAK